MSNSLVIRSAASQRLAALLSVWASVWEALAPRSISVVVTPTCVGVCCVLTWLVGDEHAALHLIAEECTEGYWRIRWGHLWGDATAWARRAASLPSTTQVDLDAKIGVIVRTDVAVLGVIATAVGAAVRDDRMLRVLTADAAHRMAPLSGETPSAITDLLDAVLEAVCEPFRDSGLQLRAFAHREPRDLGVTLELTRPGADGWESLVCALTPIPRPGGAPDESPRCWCTVRVASQRWWPDAEGEFGGAAPEVVHGGMRRPPAEAMAVVGLFAGWHLPERRM